jgi:hypothetical protein
MWLLQGRPLLRFFCRMKGVIREVFLRRLPSKRSQSVWRGWSDPLWKPGDETGG